MVLTTDDIFDIAGLKDITKGVRSVLEVDSVLREVESRERDCHSFVVRCGYCHVWSGTR